MNARMPANTGMQREAVRTRRSSTQLMVERSIEDHDGVYTCKRCGKVYTRLIEVLEDEMEHVTPEFES